MTYLMCIAAVFLGLFGIRWEKKHLIDDGPASKNRNKLSLSPCKFSHAQDFFSPIVFRIICPSLPHVRGDKDFSFLWCTCKCNFIGRLNLTFKLESIICRLTGFTQLKRQSTFSFSLLNCCLVAILRFAREELPSYLDSLPFFDD